MSLLLRLPRYQIIYCSTFLSFKDALCDGLSILNKEFNTFFNESSRIRDRKLKIQKAIIQGCLYHYSKNIHSRYNRNITTKVVPVIDYYKPIPKHIMNNVPKDLHYLIENATHIIQKLISNKYQSNERHRL